MYSCHFVRCVQRDDDTDSSSDPMVPSPPAKEDMDIVVSELLLDRVYLRGVNLYYQTVEHTCI